MQRLLEEGCFRKSGEACVWFCVCLHLKCVCEYKCNAKALVSYTISLLILQKTNHTVIAWEQKNTVKESVNRSYI